MRVVHVRMGRRSYPIRIVRGSVTGLGPTLVRKLGPRRVAVLTDPNVHFHYGETVLRTLAEAGCRAEVRILGLGERSKTVRTVQKTWSWLHDRKFDRQTVILALGGGIVGDLAGFVASTWMRGVPLAQVPTTLLAQVDSSVGGKTGFNLGGAKNMVGSFYQPAFVFSSLHTLRTLPKREFRSGLAEVIKHGMLQRPEILTQVVAGNTEDYVASCCEVKADIVQKDEQESGLRKILNFGHTFGHAIEVATKHRKRHGEAIALGMVSACRVSERLGYCGPEVRKQLVDVLEHVGLNTDDQPFWKPEVVEQMLYDKKRGGDQLSFIVAKDIGTVGIHQLPINELKRMVRAST